MDSTTARLVDIANEVQDELVSMPDDQARWRHVKGLVGAHELVVAVWQDDAAPGRVGQLIIKGEHLLRAIAAGEVGRLTSTAAIPCSCAEQAMALKQVAGEPSALH